MSYLEYVIYENYNVRLPSHWNFVPIRRGLELLTDFEANGSFAYVKDNVKLDTGDNFAWYLRATDLENKRYGLVEGNRTCDEKSYNYLKKTELEGGELLIAKRGEIGKVYSTPTFLNCKATLAPNLYLLKLEEERLLSSFAVYWFKSDLGNQILLQADKSTTIGALYKDDVKACLVAFPPIKEQQKIAAFLDYKTQQIDQLIEKKKALIEKLEEKRIAVITQAVTKGLDKNVTLKPSGVDWLGDVPEHWDVRRLQFNIKTTKGYAFKSEHFSSSGVRVVRASDIKKKTIIKSNVYLPDEFLETHRKVILQENDIIISTVGSTPDVVNSAVGQIAKVPSDCNGSLLNQNTVILKPYGKLIKEYLLYLLSATAFREHLDLHAHGTANQASLSLDDILNFQTALPPNEEQILISSHLDEEVQKINNLISLANNTIKKLEEYRSAIITSAVTGKIDVRAVELS